MGKINAKGRNKYEAHIRLHRGITNSAAWETLSCVATRLLILIWARHSGTNNGGISYSQREARVALRVGYRKVGTAFQELQDKGFLVCRSKGSFDWKVGAGEGKASEWEITEERYDGEGPKKSYKEWAKIQNPVTASVAAGNHVGSRSRQNSHRDTPSGNHVGSRYGPFKPSSGNRVGSTSNIPGAVPARIQPSLEALQAKEFTPEVAVEELREVAQAAA